MNQIQERFGTTIFLAIATGLLLGRLLFQGDMFMYCWGIPIIIVDFMVLYYNYTRLE